MAFDILGYRNKYKDYFGDASLDEVARDAFEQGGWDKETDFESWKKAKGIDSIISEDLQSRKPPTFMDKLRGATSSVAPADDSILGEIPKGLKAGVEQVKGMGYGLGVLAGKAIDSDILTKWGAEGLADVEANTPKPQVASFTDINSGSDLAKYLLYGISTNLPNMAISMGTGGIGGFLGKKAVQVAAKEAIEKAVAVGATKEAAESIGRDVLAKGITRGAVAGAGAASIGMETGSIAGDQLQETGDVDPLRTMAGAIPAGLLDVLPEYKLAKKLGWMGKDAAKFAGNRVVQSLKVGAQQFLWEAPTEAMQSVIERASVKGKSIADFDAAEEYMNSFILGGLTGAVVGGGSHAVTGLVKGKQPTEDDQALDTLQKKASLDGMIFAGMKEGNVAGHPFTPDDALAIIQHGQKEGLYSESDIDRFKDKYPALQNGLNNVAVESMKEKVSEVVSTAAPVSAEIDVPDFQEPEEINKGVTSNGQTLQTEAEIKNKEISYLKNSIARQADLLDNYAGQKGADEYKAWEESFARDKARLDELTSAYPDEFTRKLAESPEMKAVAPMASIGQESEGSASASGIEPGGNLEKAPHSLTYTAVKGSSIFNNVQPGNVEQLRSMGYEITENKPATADVPGAQTVTPSPVTAEVAPQDSLKTTDDISFPDDISPYRVSKIWDDLYSEHEAVEKKVAESIKALNDEKNSLPKGDRSGRIKAINKQIADLKEEVAASHGRIESVFQAATEEYAQKIIARARTEGITASDDEIYDVISELSNGRNHESNGGKTWDQPLAGQVIEYLKEEEAPQSQIDATNLSGQKEIVDSAASSQATPETPANQGITDGKLPEGAKNKEPWQMTKAEYLKSAPRKKNTTDAYLSGYHSSQVRMAVKQGDPVPLEVLKDYPELVTKPVSLPNDAPEPSEIFIRAAEKKDLGRSQKSLKEIPEKEGYEKVYKQKGSQGRGFYYVKAEGKEAKAETPAEKTPAKAEDIFPPPNKTTKADSIAKSAGEILTAEEAAARLAEWKKEVARINKEEDHSKQVILSLFDRTGVWSMPYAEAGYNVVTYDAANGDDIFSDNPMLIVQDLENQGWDIAGILAAPPCTSFSVSGARWWDNQHDINNPQKTEELYGVKAAQLTSTPLEAAEMLGGIQGVLVEYAKERGHSVKFYALENPVGRIAEKIGLPEPTLTFNPNNYGDPYTKKTMLWGEFNPDLPQANVEPYEGSRVYNLRGDVPEQKLKRSETPEGFAYAFFMANHPAYGVTAVEKPASPATKPTDKRQAAINKYIEHAKKHMSEDTAKAQAEKWTKAIDDKDYKTLRNIMNGINPQVNRLFTALTGLPANTQKEADASLRSFDPAGWDKWQGEKTETREKEAAERDARYKQQEIDSLLDKRIRFKGEETNYRDLFSRLVGEGYGAIEEQKRGATSVYNLANNAEGRVVSIPKKILVPYVQDLIDKQKAATKQGSKTEAPEPVQAEEQVKEPETAKQEVEEALAKAVEVPIKEIIPTKTEEKNITTPKEQKKYLIDAIDEALKSASSEKQKVTPMPSEHASSQEWAQYREQHKLDYEENKKKFGMVKIEVPNDGTFEILNTKEALTQFQKRIKAMPSTVVKGAKESPKPSTKATGKRMEMEGVSYYNDFAPRKQEVITDKVAANNHYVDGWYTDGRYALKTDKPKAEFSDAQPDIKRVIPKDLVPAKIIAEFHTGRSDKDLALVHIIGENGVENAFNAHYIDAVLTKYPNANVFLHRDAGEKPAVFKDGDEVVSVVMPIKDGVPSNEFIKEFREEERQPLSKQAEAKNKELFGKVQEKGVKYNYEKIQGAGRRYNNSQSTVEEDGNPLSRGRRDSLLGNIKYPEVGLQAVGTYKAEKDTIVSTQDAANLASHNLSSNTQEHFVVIATDKNSKILSIYRHSTGGKRSTLVDPDIIVGRALNIPDAENIWIVHNHPSGGETKLSPPDKNTANKITNLLNGTHITMGDFLAATDTHYDSLLSGKGNITAVQDKKNIPVVDRIFKTRGEELQKISSPNDVLRFGSQIIPDGGIILLSNSNKTVGVIPIEKYSQIRGEVQQKILQEIEKTNASAMAVYDPQNKTILDADNIQKFANAAGVDFLDIVTLAGSKMEQGTMPSKNSVGDVFYAKKTAPTRGISTARIQSIVGKVTSTLNINPKINVVQHVSECPAAVLKDMEKNGILDENSDADVQGFAWNGETWLVADNLDSNKDAFKVLMHELTHNGLGALLNGKAKLKPVQWQYNNLMDKIISAHRRDIMTIARTTHTHLNLNTIEGRRQAAEEWLCNQSYEAQHKWYDKLITIFNNLVRAMGLDIKLSDSEVRTILREAFQTFEGKNDEVRYMVAAWHGSKERFNKFSSQKIKTGSFGHGHYFSSMREIAEQYKEGGHLYQVTLTPDESDFLDWDRPINKQSKYVQDVLNNSAIRDSLDAYEDAGGYVDTGKDVYLALMNEQGSAKAASQLLSDYGIAGNKYLDSSQGKGADNYVLFDDQNVKIEARYAGENVRYSIMPKNEIPRRTVTAYKLFQVKKKEPGKLYPLFIGRDKPFEVGIWYKAEHIPTKGFAERPGIHSGVLPTAPHLMKKDGTMPSDRVWAEISITGDVDWQKEADKSKTKDIRDKIPDGGYYRFKTNKMQGGAWFISGGMKIEKILSSRDVEDILDEDVSINARYARKDKPQSEAWRDTSKWDVPESELSWMPPKEESNEFDFLGFSIPEVNPEEHIINNRQSYIDKLLKKYQPPVKTRFMTQENVDEISTAILALKENKLTISQFNHIVDENLPLPPKGAENRGSGMYGDINLGPNIIEESMASFLGSYLAGKIQRWSPIDNKFDFYNADTKNTKIVYNPSMDQFGGWSVQHSDTFSTGGFKTKKDAEDYLKKISSGEPVMDEYGPEVGGPYYKAHPQTYDKVIKEFRNNPTKLLRTALEHIKGLLDEDAEGIRQLMSYYGADGEFNPEAIARRNAEEIEKRRASFKVIKNELPNPSSAPDKGVQYTRKGNTKISEFKKLSQEAALLERQVDNAYENDDPRAEELDAQLSILKDKIEGIAHEYESESHAVDEGVSLEEELANAYHTMIVQNFVGYSKEEAINNFRAALANRGANVNKATDEEILAAAKDAYDQRKAMIDRYNGVRYSIRKPQDPPASSDPKVLNFYLKDETDAIAKTIKSKLHPGRMTWLETILKSPEWFDHPQINKIVKLFMRDRNEIYHETFNELNAADNPFQEHDTVVEAGKALRNKGLSLTERAAGKVSKEYERLIKILDEGDTTWQRNRSKSLAEQVKEFEDHIRKQGATADTIAVWKLYRESYDKALDLQTRQMKDMIEKITEEARFKGETPDLTEMNKTLKGALAQMEEWRGFYAPRIREQGDWKVQAYKEHGPLRENREWYREHKNSELSAQRLANKLKREGWKVYNVGKVERLPEGIYQDVNAVATAKLIDDALDKMKKRSDLQGRIMANFDEEILRAVADEIRARGFRSTMIHRKEGAVIRGFIEDPIQRHLLYINQLSGGISKAQVARMAMEELLGKDVMGNRVGGIDPVADPKAYMTAENYIREQLRNLDSSDKIIGIAKSIATFKFLGFNMRSLAVNTTAILTTAPVAIHQYAMGGKGSLLGIMKELGVSGKDYGLVMAGKKLQNRDEQRFIDDMHKKGWDDAQYTREALGELSKVHSKVWSTVMDYSMKLFGYSEKWNRGTTMLAAYRLARKKGLDHYSAAEAAKESCDKAHGVYGRSTLPMWAQGANPAAKIGQMMYVYSKFGHNYMQMLYDMGFKKRNIKGAMFAFLAPLVLAGGAAMPFKDAIFGFAGFILSALFGWKEDPEKWVWDTIRKHLGRDAEKIGRHGLTGAAGVDISGSLSIGVGIPKDFIDLTGAVGGVATELKEAGENLGRGNVGRAAEHLLPSGFANPARALRESSEGVSTRNNRRVWGEDGKPYIPGTAATIARAAGFRSTDQAVLSERTWEGHRQQAEIAERRSAIYEKYRAWLLGGRKREEYKKIVKEVQEFNKAAKKLRGESLITSQSLKNQVRRMQKPSKKERSILAE